MSNRPLRIGELVQRELGDYLRKRYRSEAVTVTVTGVEVAPDLKTGRIYFGVLGLPDAVETTFAWLQTKQAEFRRELARRISIKHSPDWELCLDLAAERGARILTVLDEIAQREGLPPPRGATPQPPGGLIA